MSENPLITLLNNSLAGALDLKLQAKQAHWNVKGANFIALHELFDAVATEIEAYADMLAERVVQLGGRAEGTVAKIAERTTLKPYPLAAVLGDAHVAALTDALRVYAESTRVLIDKSADLGDAVTADLLTEVTRGLDKQRWFIEAHSAK